MKAKIIGFTIFIVLAVMIWYIITKSCESTFQGFSTINDFFTSILFLFGFIFAFFIYLINQKIIPTQNALKIIDNMPDFLPFKHSFKSYFSKLIKKDSKIIILIRTLDEKNHEWVLNQISAYNSIYNHYPDIKKRNIEFLFVNKYSNEIKTLIGELNTTQYDYIVISSLSAIFKDAIMARENLSKEIKESIQIIGALSSINDREIQQIIDNDEKIIRIFPPDYDEAKTAMEFLFSKIKNSICTNENCDFHNKRNNVIVIHNGTYGRAVRDKCDFYFNKEFHYLNLNTSNNLLAKDIDRSIQFYSFDYKSDEQLIYDKIKSDSFDSFLDEWSNADNYFYIIGYEPNISNILQHLDKLLSPHPKLNFSLIFSGTASMNRWRESIKKSLIKSQNLNSCLPNCAYYLKLHTVEETDSMKEVRELNVPLKHYRSNSENESANILDEMTELFKESKHITEVSNILESSWKSRNNYITMFTTDSINIAFYAIDNKVTLLNSKFKVLRDNRRKTDILVNGDSINQYTVNILD